LKHADGFIVKGPASFEEAGLFFKKNRTEEFFDLKYLNGSFFRYKKAFPSIRSLRRIFLDRQP